MQYLVQSSELEVIIQTFMLTFVVVVRILAGVFNNLQFFFFSSSLKEKKIKHGDGKLAIPVITRFSEGIEIRN